MEFSIWKRSLSHTHTCNYGAIFCSIRSDSFACSCGATRRATCVTIHGSIQKSEFITKRNNIQYFRWFFSTLKELLNHSIIYFFVSPFHMKRLFRKVAVCVGPHSQRLARSIVHLMRRKKKSGFLLFSEEPMNASRFAVVYLLYLHSSSTSNLLSPFFGHSKERKTKR